MGKANDQDRLLDVWVPPKDAGDPIGFIATSFTFGAQFFEEDCLSAFLQMESDPDSEGLAYLIEREEKLSKVACAMVLVDQHHCSSRQRNIRWDLIPFRMKNGIQHAKISLLVWSNSIRLVIGSANLTEEAYRRNQEIYAVLEASENEAVPLEVFYQTFNFLEHLLASGVTTDAAISQRGKQLIQRVRQVFLAWNLTDSNQAVSTCLVWPVFVRPGQPSVFAQLRERWQNSYSFLPDELQVVSPFFDATYSEVHPIAKLNELLNPKASVEMITSGEKDKEANGLRRIHLPAYYEKQLKDRLMVGWLPELVEEGKEWRPLHLKALRAFKGNWGLLMLGSSNFTAAGMGTAPNNTNYEANLLYIASASKHPESYKALTQSIPKWKTLKLGEYELDEIAQSDENEQFDTQPLPDCIRSAEADLVDNKTIIRLAIDLTKLLPDLEVKTDSGEIIFSSRLQATNEMVEYVWYDPLLQQAPLRSLPAGFMVSWAGSEKHAWLPLNVKNYEVLPPPEELKALPFHVLLQVLTSAKPLHVLLRRYNKQLKAEALEDNTVDPMTDPHKRVDTSGFLLQRTRRISYAFNAIREKLSAPISTQQSLNWRLYGPVGLMALVKAILSDAEDAELKLPEERSFFLAELILELSTLQTSTATNHLPAETVRVEIQQFIAKITPNLLEDKALKDSWIKPYVEKTITKAMQTTL